MKRSIELSMTVRRKHSKTAQTKPKTEFRLTAYRTRLRSFILLAGTLACFPLYAASLPAVSSDEIKHLLTYLEQSNCQFQRNGSWYDAHQARVHLEKKLNYLLDKDMVVNAEDFIQRAATESSMSGKPYQVRCGNENNQPSKQWFESELRHYRSLKGVNK